MDISAERNDDGYNNDDGVTSARRISNGRWKDGTCDWCTLYLCTAFCSVISLAQVMTRMQLNWLGQSTYRASSRGSLTTKYSACRVVTAIVIGYTVLYFLQLSAFLDELDDGNSNKNKKGQSPKSSTTMDVVLVSIMPFVSLTYGVWCLYIHYKTRVTIRGRYQIREECCPGVDDCMCVLCCPFWSVIQMSRHTGDFDRQRASCCSETGLEDMDEFRSGAMMV
jgi:Cys-rich protein (TIGR01571 family)